MSNQKLTFAEIAKKKPTKKSLPVTLKSPKLYEEDNAWYYEQVNGKIIKLPKVTKKLQDYAKIISDSLIVFFSETNNCFDFNMFCNVKRYNDYIRTHSLEDVAYIINIEVEEEEVEEEEEEEVKEEKSKSKHEKKSTFNLEKITKLGKSICQESVRKPQNPWDMWKICTGKYVNPCSDQVALMYLVTSLYPEKKLKFYLDGKEINRHSFNWLLSVCEE